MIFRFRLDMELCASVHYYGEISFSLRFPTPSLFYAYDRMYRKNEMYFFNIFQFPCNWIRMLKTCQEILYCRELFNWWLESSVTRFCKFENSLLQCWLCAPSCHRTLICNVSHCDLVQPFFFFRTLYGWKTFENSRKIWSSK